LVDSPPALLKAIDAKLKKYGESCSAANVDFLPLAFDTLGGVSDDGKAFLDRLFRETGTCCDLPPFLALKYGYEKLSVCLQQSVSRQVLSRGDSSLHNSVLHVDPVPEPSFIPSKPTLLDEVGSPVLGAVVVDVPENTIEIVVKSVLERLPVKVAEIIVPVINPVDTVGELKTVKEHYEKKAIWTERNWVENQSKSARPLITRVSQSRSAMPKIT